MTVSTITLGNVAALNRGARPYGVIYRDAAMKNGLFLRVSPTGKQVWWVERKNSRNRRIQRMLGEYPAMDLEAARVACARVIAEIAATGVRDVTDVSEQTLWQAFVGWGRDSHLTDSTLKKYERMLRRHTSEWLDKPLHLLTAAWLKATCESITNKYGTTSSSRQLVRIVRELANYVGLPSNPAAGMRIPVTPTVAYGQRHICTAVLPGLFEAIDMLDPYPRAYYYTLLFTGFRPSFARVMEWSLLKLEGEGAPTYRISDSAVNSGRGGAGEIPLHPYLEAELRTLRKHHAKHGVGSPYPADPHHASACARPRFAGVAGRLRWCRRSAGRNGQKHASDANRVGDCLRPAGAGRSADGVSGIEASQGRDLSRGRDASRDAPSSSRGSSAAACRVADE